MLELFLALGEAQIVRQLADYSDDGAGGRQDLVQRVLHEGLLLELLDQRRMKVVVYFGRWDRVGHRAVWECLVLEGNGVDNEAHVVVVLGHLDVAHEQPPRSLLAKFIEGDVELLEGRIVRENDKPLQALDTIVGDGVV